MTFQYNREADILSIDICEPYPEQESEEFEDEIIARFNPKTKPPCNPPKQTSRACHFQKQPL